MTALQLRWAHMMLRGHVTVNFIVQALIAFALHRGVIVIPKSVTAERVHSNYEAQKITLDDDDMKKFHALEQNLRYLRFFMMKKGQTMEDFWDMEYDKNYVVDAPDAKRSKTDE